MRTLMAMREEILCEMEVSEASLGKTRSQIERIESDLRLGQEAPLEYPVLKGKDLPAVERRLIELYGELLKIEDKIRASRGSGSP